MIEETLKIHDLYQFEIKQSYDLPSDGDKNSYYVQTFLFIPNNLNINKDTYSSADFFSDLHTYIRLKTPLVPLRDFMGIESFRKCSRSLSEFISNPGMRNFNDLDYQIKMYCTLFKRSMLRQLSIIRAGKTSTERQDQIHEFIESVKAAVINFRSISPDIKKTPDLRIQSLFRLADEYMSLKAESHSFRLLEMIRNTPENDIFGKIILSFIKDEITYRDKNSYPSILSEKDDGENESFIYRQSVLKKYLSSVLFLETRTKREGVYVEQFLYSIAAGIAMLFATAVAFISQDLYGRFTLPVFAALVISYVFKDRLKDLMKIYFTNTMKRWLYDRKRNIYHSFRKKIGCCRESFHYISEKRLPPEIKEKRERDILTDIDNSLTGETIILYRKFVSLKRKPDKNIREGYPVSGITDIVRFNTGKFLRTMDDPQKNIFIPADGTYKKIRANRVYHINIIIQYTFSTHQLLKKFRIILNRQGIRRIEEVE